MAQAWSEPVYWNEAVDIKSGAFTPDTGTETIAGVTVTLKVAGVTVVDEEDLDQGENGGWVATADAGPYAWYTLDPKALAAAEPTLIAEPAVQQNGTLQFTATDSLGRRYVSVVAFTLLPAGS